ncbi:Retrovirus-related Pol polyprotein from transposon [Dictyocoela roeselum]|nr:Retrovirus-related Pol polyprotein from transposon [Dictyocoela roeselum]
MKANGGIRLVVDYRKLNAITLKTVYISTITEILTQLHEAKFFSKIDLNLGYYQIPMEERSMRYTPISINNNKYEFRRMPFRLSNAPSTFQEAMDRILGSLPYVKVYLDDILTHSKNETDHYEHIKNVLETLHENHLSINFKNCKFFQKEVKFLGHIISENGIKPAIEKT